MVNLIIINGSSRQIVNYQQIKELALDSDQINKLISYFAFHQLQNMTVMDSDYA